MTLNVSEREEGICKRSSNNKTIWACYYSSLLRKDNNSILLQESKKSTDATSLSILLFIIYKR